MRLVPAVRLFGPVLLYDMVRSARRGRYVLIRCLYATVLAATLGLIYLSWYADRGGSTIRASEMAEFAASFFFTFMGLQFATVALLTPAYTAGAIAEEKERRTLEFLLATDLRNSELVLGKLTSRLAGLGLIVLTGLPVLSLLQLQGGVDPVLVLAGFLATIVTMLSLAGMSILGSVQLRRARDAIITTYLVSLLYLTLSGLSWLLTVPDGWANWPSTTSWTSPVTVQDVVEWTNAGNVVAGVIRMAEASGKADLQELALEYLLPYVLFHGVVAVGCTTWAVYRVRHVALLQAQGATPKAARIRRRPAVGRRPVRWKEVYIEGRVKTGWFRFLLGLVLVVLSFVPAVWIALYVLFYDFNHLHELAEALGWWARIAGTAVVCLTLLNVAIRAAGSITGEQERQTFDALLTSPLTSRDILFGKWLGSILSARGGWIWASSIFAVGVLVQGISVFAVPLLLVAWCSYAAFAAGMGLWFSLYCRTSMRAVVAAVFAAIMISGGHWLLWTCAIPIALLDGNARWAESIAELLAMYQAFAQTPPITLGALALQGWEWRETGHVLRDTFNLPFVVVMISFALLGVVLCALEAFIWWKLAVWRFVRLYRRISPGALRKPVQSTIQPEP